MCIARAAVAGWVAVSAFVLAACGGGADTSSSITLSGSGAFDPDREGPAAPVEGAVAGGTVTVLAADFDSVQLKTVDPTETYNFIPLSLLSGLVTRSLTQYVYDPDQKAMVLVPDIATDLGTPNADFTEWTYTIRDGVRFEDGTEVTAEDVAYGIKRSFDRPTFRQGPGYSNDFFLDGDTYKGVYTSGTEYPGVVVEGNTLTLKMDQPFPDMPYWGTFPAMGPIPEQGSDPDRYALHPLATGPYKIAEFTPAESLTLVRNEEWDPDTDPGRHAYPDRYEIDFAQRSSEIDTLILGDSQQGQTTVSLSPALPQNYQQAQNLDRLVEGPGPCTFMWYPDYRKIPELKVRQAIGYAFPYAEAIQARQASGLNTRLPDPSVLPLGFPGRQDYDVLAGQPGSTDPDRAKALLQAAGHAPGEYELSFAFSPESSIPETLLVTSLEAAGFKVTPFLVPAEDIDDVQRDPNAPTNVRNSGWCPDWPSGGSWFPPLFESGSGDNLAFFAEPAVDAEIERIQALPFQDQPAAWGALDETIMTDYYPAITNGYLEERMLQGSRIGGLHVDSVIGTPTWKDIHVKP